MFAAKDGADNVRRQNRETEEPRCIGRNDALGLGNILEGQAQIPKKPIPDCVGPDEKTHETNVGSYGLRSVTDNNPHLFAGALETSRDRQRYNLAIGIGLVFFFRLGGSGCFIEALARAILIQCDVDAVRMNLNADDVRTHKCVEVLNFARAYFSGALDRPLLSCRLGTDVPNLLKDGGIRKPMAYPTYEKRLKRNCRDALALGSGFCRPSQQ
jgi:hypothetical protein